MGLFGTLVTACSDRAVTTLDRVKQDGYLIVVTRQSPTTYFHGPYGEMGLEYELTSRFARSLGVRLKFIIPERHEDILTLVENRKAHLAAAGLTITNSPQKNIRFGSIYQEITQQLVYRLGKPKPKSFTNRLSGKLRIKSGSAHSAHLRKIKEKYPALSWEESLESETEELMHEVWRKNLDYTIADSNEVATIQRYYPELRVAFNLKNYDKNGKIVKQNLGWAFRNDNDNSLYNEAQKFFLQMKKSGKLAQLKERYYGHIDQFNYFQITSYHKHIKERLPKYRRAFQKEAKRYNMDWRLLAAIGYQESLWNPKAISPTGVRGLMMLTRGTARQMRIKNRRDPFQSIAGGAKYFNRMKKKINIQVSDPDRTWFALAAYNVGRLHLVDAQIIVRQTKGDPYRWIDVRKALPLLTKAKWYKKARFGYARGYEPVIYVRNIRRFYDLLVRYEQNQALHSVAKTTTKKSAGDTRVIAPDPVKTKTKNEASNEIKATTTKQKRKRKIKRKKRVKPANRQANS